MAEACSLVLDEMYNKSSSARESIVDLARRTLERTPALWVIASGATVIRCRRQWIAFLRDPAFPKKRLQFVYDNDDDVFRMALT